MDKPMLSSDIKKLKAPIIVGIAGDSGSGKTTFSSGIRKLLGTQIVQTVEMDGYHKENREERAKSGRSPLEPEANRFDLIKEHLEKLKNNQAVDVPIYNHETGLFDTTRHLEPSPVIIYEGLHALYPDFRKYVDFSIYVDPSRSIKWDWKKQRDIEKRGHDESALIREMLYREALYKRWIDFQKTNATIVVKILPSRITEYARYEFAGILCTESYRYELIMERTAGLLPSVPIPFDLSYITDFHTPSFMLASVPSRYWGRDAVTIHFDGELHPATS
jgi:phosphoribulokinase